MDSGAWHTCPQTFQAEVEASSGTSTDCVLSLHTVVCMKFSSPSLTRWGTSSWGQCPASSICTRTFRQAASSSLARATALLKGSCKSRNANSFYCCPEVPPCMHALKPNPKIYDNSVHVGTPEHTCSRISRNTSSTALFEPALDLWETCPAQP